MRLPRPSRLALSLALSSLTISSVARAQSRADATLCERVGNARIQEARATFLQGCAAMAADRFSDAADLFERVVKSDDRNAVAHFYLGQAYGAQAERANVFKQASLARKTKSEFDRAVQLDPDYVDARAGLVQFYWQAPGIVGGSKDKAREQIDEIRRRDPYRAGLISANLASRDKDTAGALRAYEQLATQFPDSIGVQVNVISLEVQLKQYDGAFQHIDRLQRAHPDAMLAQYVLGRTSAESGQQLERGEQALRRYLAYTPKSNEPSLAAAHWRLGMIQQQRGQTENARAEYRTALSLDPKLAGAKESLSKLK